MAKQTTRSNESSNIVWNSLEEMVRMKVREYIQDCWKRNRRVVRASEVGAPEAGRQSAGLPQRLWQERN